MLTIFGFKRQADGSYKISASKLLARLTWLSAGGGLGAVLKLKNIIQ